MIKSHIGEMQLDYLIASVISHSMMPVLHTLLMINISRPRQNGREFPNDMIAKYTP